MSSGHDESTEMLEEPSLKSDAEKGCSSPSKKFPEHAKPKRRRRGKKRKQRKSSGAAESENQEDSETHPATEGNRDSQPWDSDEELDCETNAYSDVIIRPVNVPKAPENSTQFIIDDHNLCHLYMSFETPNPYLPTDPPDSGKEDIVQEPAGIDAAYIDIDYEYDPPQDFDNSAYYNKDFEMSYQSNRFDELLRLPRAEILAGLRMLEARVKELSDELVKVNHSPLLEHLQTELLELQEKHSVLKDTNTTLRAQLSEREGKTNVSADVSSAKLNDTNLEETPSQNKSPLSDREMECIAERLQGKASVESMDTERTSEKSTLETETWCFFEQSRGPKLPEDSTREDAKVKLINELEDVRSSGLAQTEIGSRLWVKEARHKDSELEGNADSELEEDKVSSELEEEKVNSELEEEKVNSELEEEKVNSELEEEKVNSELEEKVNSELEEEKVNREPEDTSLRGHAELKSSCDLERIILRDCRDVHGCEETSHSVASDEHELSAAVFV